MKLISENQLVLDAPAEWQRRHFVNGQWRGATKEAAYQRLMALDLHTVSAEDVNAAVESDLLPITHCDFCGRRSYRAVVLTTQTGEEFCICPVCVGTARSLIGYSYVEGYGIL